MAAELEPSEGKIVDGSTMFDAEKLLLRGWSVAEVARHFEVSKALVSEWVGLLRDGGSPLPVSMDARAMRARRAALAAGMDRTVAFLGTELEGLMHTAEKARKAVDSDLDDRRDPIEVGANETEKLISRRGVLLSPQEAMKVYIAAMDEIHRTAASVASYLDRVESVLDELNTEGHEIEVLKGVQVLDVQTVQERRAKLRRSA